MQDKSDRLASVKYLSKVEELNSAIGAQKREFIETIDMTLEILDSMIGKESTDNELKLNHLKKIWITQKERFGNV